MSHDDAQENCMEKFKNYGGGRLFEPQSLLENDNVAGFGYGVLGEKWSYTWLHIGVTDNVQEGTWAYDSDGSNISFVPAWSSYSNSNSNYSNCIVFGANEYGQGTGDWYVESCTSYSWWYDFMSVCESLLNK